METPPLSVCVSETSVRLALRHGEPSEDGGGLSLAWASRFRLAHRPPSPRARRSYLWVHGVNVVTPHGGRASPPPGWSQHRQRHACPRLPCRGRAQSLAPSFPSSSSRSALGGENIPAKPLSIHTGAPGLTAVPTGRQPGPPPAPSRVPGRCWSPHEPLPFLAPGVTAPRGSRSSSPVGAGCLSFRGV